MIYEVRILDPEGNVKKVISRNELSRRYWKDFNEAEDRISLLSTGRTPVPVWVKRRLDLEFPYVPENGLASS